MSELYQENMKRQNKDRRWKDGLAFPCILLESLIVAVNINTFVEQGELVPGELTDLAKLIRRVGLSLYGVQILSTFLNMLSNTVPAVFAYRLVGRKFIILSCIYLLAVSILVDELPTVPITGDVLLVSAFGGILSGLGMSLALNSRVYGGGADSIAMSLSVKYKVSTFDHILLFSMVITLISGTIFGVDKALYSTIFQFCNTQTISTSYKKYKKKTLLIMTDNPTAVSVDLLELVNHSNMTLKGFDPYSANKKCLIYTVLLDNDVRKVGKWIREQYSDISVNVINSSDVVGNFYVQPLE